MIKEVMLSIKKDLDRAFFYWIVLTLSSMFIFMFFHLSTSDSVGVTFINSKNDITTNLTIFVILICMIIIFMANDFYVKKKSRELSCLLVCGASYLQLVQFLLLQTGFILILSLPVGFLVGYMCFPILTSLLSHIFSYDIEIHLSLYAIVCTSIIMSFEIFWCTLLNLGYAYRNSIRSLMYGEEKIKFGKLPKITIEIAKFIYAFLYLGCVVGLYFIKDNMNAIFLLGFLGLIGLNGCIKNVVIPFVDSNIKNKWINDDEKIVYMGFFRNDLKLMNINIFILIASSILLLAIMGMSIHNSIETALCLLSYIVMSFLLSLSLMFRFSSELAGRKKYFISLSKLGYMYDKQKRIMKKEIVLLYGFILIISLVYIFNMMFVLYLHSFITMSSVCIILLVFIIPVVLCGIINYLYYRKILVKE
jgi:hypothetical protein